MLNISAELVVPSPPLRPSGVMDLDGKRIDVVTTGEYITEGSSVHVVDVRGSRVEVRESRESDETKV